MDKRDRMKAGLQFGVVMAIIYVVQSLVSMDSYTTKNVLVAVVAALLSGALSGVMFSWILGWFVHSKFLRNSTSIVTEPGEHIVFETGANHFKGIEGVGGKLYLTNKRLVFQSHSVNIQRHGLSINLQNIRETKRYKTIGILNNGIAVTTENHTEKFVVQKPDQWAIHLTNNTTSQGLPVLQ